MRKLLHRCIALLLVPCLALSEAEGLGAFQKPLNYIQAPKLKTFVETEALAQRLTTPLHPLRVLGHLVLIGTLVSSMARGTAREAVVLPDTDDQTLADKRKKKKKRLPAAPASSDGMPVGVPYDVQLDQALQVLRELTRLSGRQDLVVEWVHQITTYITDVLTPKEDQFVRPVLQAYDCARRTGETIDWWIYGLVRRLWRVNYLIAHPRVLVNLVFVDMARSHLSYLEGIFEKMIDRGIAGYKGRPSKRAPQTDRIERGIARAITFLRRHNIKMISNQAGHPVAVPSERNEENPTDPAAEVRFGGPILKVLHPFLRPLLERSGIAQRYIVDAPFSHQSNVLSVRMAQNGYRSINTEEGRAHAIEYVLGTILLRLQLTLGLPDRYKEILVSLTEELSSSNLNEWFDCMSNETMDPRLGYGALTIQWFERNAVQLSPKARQIVADILPTMHRRLGAYATNEPAPAKPYQGRTAQIMRSMTDEMFDVAVAPAFALAIPNLGHRFADKVFGFARREGSTNFGSGGDTSRNPPVVPGQLKAQKPVILFVNDSAVFNKKVCQRLNRLFGSRFEIATAFDGQKGLELFRKLKSKGRSVALVISDFNMPLLNGLQMVQAIHSMDALVPVLFESSWPPPELDLYATGKSHVAVMESGDFLKEIRKSVERLLKQSSPTAPAEEDSDAANITDIPTFDTDQEVSRFLDHIRIGPQSQFVSVGPYMPVLSRYPNDPTSPIPWEGLALKRGAHVTVYEPDESANLAWQNIIQADPSSEMHKRLTVPSAQSQEAHLQSTSFADKSVDVVVMISVLSDLYIKSEIKRHLLETAVRILKEDGCLIIGAYRTWETPATLLGYGKAIRDQSIPLLLEQLPSAEWRDTLQTLQVLPDEGFRLEPIAIGAGPYVYPHAWIAIRVQPASARSIAEPAEPAGS